MYRLFKSLCDRLAAALGLLLLSPILILLILGLWWVNGDTPFFVQVRPGKKAKPFKLLKFKSMRDAYDAQGAPLPDHERITPIGRLVRQWSLDELLQLVNVLKGDMSLVGPRPLLMEYLPLYNAFQARRHEVLPGITGWAQVKGRNAISWEQRFALDVEYVEKQGLWMDLRILALTVGKVLNRSGVNSSSSVTMEKFEGNG